MGRGTPDQPHSWMTEDGVLVHDLKGFGHLNMALIRQLTRQHNDLTGGAAASVLVLAEELKTIDFDVQRLVSRSRESNLISALSVVCDSFMVAQLSRTLVEHHQPVYPMRVFVNREEAEAWLRSV